MEYKFGDLQIIISSEGQVRFINGENEIYVGFPNGVRFNMMLQSLELAKDINRLNSWADRDTDVLEGEQ